MLLTRKFEDLKTYVNRLWVSLHKPIIKTKTIQFLSGFLKKENIICYHLIKNANAISNMANRRHSYAPKLQEFKQFPFGILVWLLKLQRTEYFRSQCLLYTLSSGTGCGKCINHKTPSTSTCLLKKQWNKQHRLHTCTLRQLGVLTASSWVCTEVVLTPNTLYAWSMKEMHCVHPSFCWVKNNLRILDFWMRGQSLSQMV